MNVNFVHFAPFSIRKSFDTNIIVITTTFTFNSNEFLANTHLIHLFNNLLGN